MPCEYCDDGEGRSVYPYYGMAPHRHEGSEMVGSTVIAPKEEWPENFCEDGEEPGLGVWTHCLHCQGQDV